VAVRDYERCPRFIDDEGDDVLVRIGIAVSLAVATAR
jgi:hypothetical protein